MSLLKRINELSAAEIAVIEKSTATAMRNNLELWGNSDYNLVVDCELLAASVDHNTITNDDDCVSISMYGFESSEWGVYNEDEDEIEPVGSMEEWMGSELFKFRSLFRNAIEILEEEESYNS